MTYTHKENRGSLFPNTKKTKDTQPDRNGTLNVEGKLYYISAWDEPGKGGKPFLSLSVKPVEQRQEQKPKQPGGFDQMDDDKPW